MNLTNTNVHRIIGDFVVMTQGSYTIYSVWSLVSHCTMYRSASNVRSPLCFYILFTCSINFRHYSQDLRPYLTSRWGHLLLGSISRRVGIRGGSRHGTPHTRDLQTTFLLKGTFGILLEFFLLPTKRVYWCKILRFL